MGVADARPLGVGEILNTGIRLYLRNSRLLMGLAATVVIPLEAITWVVLRSTISRPDQLPGAFSAKASAATANSSAAVGAEVVLVGFGLIASAFVTAACVKAVSDLYLGHPTSFEQSLRFAGRRLLAYLVMEVLYLAGLAIGFLLLIIPGVWLYGAWSVSGPALLIEGLSPTRALERSAHLVQGRWFPTAGVLLVTVLITALVTALLQSLLVGTGGESVLAGITLVVLAGAISSIVTTPFTATVWTILYYDLRARREGFDVVLLAAQLGLPSASLPGGYDPPIPGGG